MKKAYTYQMALAAYNFYMGNLVDYTEVAKYLTQTFCKKFTCYDVGRIFRHIVVWGKNDKVAEELTYAVNKRTEHNTYGKFLALRKRYPNLKKEYDRLTLILSNADRFLETNIDDFISSEDEEYILELQKTLEEDYEKAKTIDYTVYRQIENEIKKIENYKIGSLL